MCAFDLHPPVMNAAGSLGFTPDPHGPIDLETLGAFITNPISRAARKPANGTRQVEYSGGVLLHSGHPNPGFKEALRRFAPRWERAPVQIIVHLLAEKPDELESMAAQVEELGNILALEIGLRHDIDIQDAKAFVHAAQGELPVIAHIPLGRALDLGEVAYQAGVAAISLAPPRGTLPGPNGELVSGRIYSPALFPQAVSIAQEFAKQKIPIIVAGGVYNQEQVDIMLEAGALAVQLDTGLWRGGWGDKKSNILQ